MSSNIGRKRIPGHAESGSLTTGAGAWLGEPFLYGRDSSVAPLTVDRPFPRALKGDAIPMPSPQVLRGRVLDAAASLVASVVLVPLVVVAAVLRRQHRRRHGS